MRVLRETGQRFSPDNNGDAHSIDHISSTLLHILSQSLDLLQPQEMAQTMHDDPAALPAVMLRYRLAGQHFAFAGRHGLARAVVG